MKLKLLIYKARLNGVPVYCLFLLVVYLIVKYMYSRPAAEDFIPKNLHKYLMFDEHEKVSWPTLSPREMNALSTTIDVLNFEREVFNLQRYGAVQADTTMIVVRVNRDAERLQYLIISLGQVHYIQNAVVIFSHSFFDDRINKMIMSITYCRFMQIYYPFSNQLFPSRFPGMDPGDCIKHGKDIFCSGRDARRTEAKHHWWWQAHFVFNYLDWSPKYKGTVIFLEENNYVLPDLLYMLRFAKRSLVAIPGVYVMALGRPYTKNLDYDILIVDTWRPPFDRGLAFNKTVWMKISALSSHFCMYDDLSWSYSLLNLFSKFRVHHVDMVACMAPRVLNTGMYPTGRVALERITAQVKGAPFFPASVKAALVYSSTGRVDSGYSIPTKGSGGWSDIRDHLLCMNPFASTESTTAETVVSFASSTNTEELINSTISPSRRSGEDAQFVAFVTQ